jgi:hypothetical protein
VFVLRLAHGQLGRGDSGSARVDAHKISTEFPPKINGTVHLDKIQLLSHHGLIKLLPPYGAARAATSHFTSDRYPD